MTTDATERLEGTVPLAMNRNPLVVAGRIPQPPQDEIKATPTLWNASLDDAVKYGGDLTRAALSAMKIRGDKRHVIVDTKVHMLAPGQYPALPGWHTDGTPRLTQGIGDDVLGAFSPLELAASNNAVLGAMLHPQHKGLPVIHAQEYLESPRFHLLVTGHGCLTQFIEGEVVVDVPKLPSRALYGEITKQVRSFVEDGRIGRDDEVFDVPSCAAVEWDWWALHQAQAAREVEWRFLIRVTESDYNEPQDDLRKIIRTQAQVFVPSIDTGW